MCDIELYLDHSARDQKPNTQDLQLIYYIDNTHYDPKQLEARGGGNCLQVIYLLDSQCTQKCQQEV